MVKECEKKSPLRCLNCDKNNCDMQKITKILNDLGVLYGTEEAKKRILKDLS